MKFSKEIKTAILVLSGIFLFVYMFNYLKGDGLFTNQRIYYSKFKNVGGLAPSTPVSINGLKVGKVKSVDFTDDGTANLVVTLAIESDFEFSINSKVQLYDASLLGGKGVNILPAFDNGEIAKSGTYLTGVSSDQGISGMIDKKIKPIQDQVENVMSNANSVLGNVNGILDSIQLNATLLKLNQTLTSYKQTSDLLNEMLVLNKDTLTATLSNLKQISSSIDRDTLSNVIHNLSKSLTSLNLILNQMNSGNGTLGKLLNDDNMYQNLEGATKQLEALLQDFKLNPERYIHVSVFGKKTKPYDAASNKENDN